MNLNAKIVKVLGARLGKATVLADALEDLAAAERVLQKIFLGGRSQRSLHSVKEDVEEFLAVTLDSCVGWVSIKVFEREDQVSRIITLPLSLLQISEKSLNL